jgi:hypothetical protein
MKTSKKVIKLLGLFLFYTGIFTSICFSIAIVLADGEAAFYFYDPANLAPGRVKSFQCPLLITTSEIGEIHVPYRNSSGQTIKPFLRVNFADPDGNLRSSVQQETIHPGETFRYVWTISRNDEYRHNILAQVVQTPMYPNPAAQNTCGIILINLPTYTGRQILFFVMITIGVLMGLGITTFLLACRPMVEREKRIINSMTIFLAATLITLIVGCSGIWALGLVLIVINILLISSKILFQKF